MTHSRIVFLVVHIRDTFMFKITYNLLDKDITMYAQTEEGLKGDRYLYESERQF